MDPISMGVMAAASLATTVAGTAMNMSAASASADYQAQVARNNQIIANNQASYARAAAEVTAQDQGQKDAAQLGKAKALAGASGLDSGSGSFQDVQEGNYEMSSLNQLRIRNDADVKAYGYKIQGMNAENDAKLAELKGDYGVASSLITGINSVSDKWAGYKKSGVF
jgi:nucleotide-binding universal stress UspA family protein